MDWLEPDWLDSIESKTTCSRSQVVQTLQYALFTGQMFVNPVYETGISGINLAELDERYLSFYKNTYPFGSTFRMMVYDSVWAAALALNITQTKLHQNGRHLCQITGMHVVEYLVY